MIELQNLFHKKFQQFQLTKICLKIIGNCFNCYHLLKLLLSYFVFLENKWKLRITDMLVLQLK